VLIVFARELWRKRRASVFAAALAVLALGGAWTCYDNQAVTGNPFLLPHVLHQRQYNVVSLWVFLPLRSEPVYSNPRLAAQHGINGWEVSGYEPQRSRWQFFWTGFIALLQRFKYSLAIPILLTLLVPVAWRDPLFRKMAIVAGVFLLALSVETFHFFHYTAPVWAALALMIAIWAERAWNLRIRKLPVGAALVLLALTSPAAIALHVELTLLRNPAHPPFYNEIWNRPLPGSWTYRRAALIEQLSALDRPQLVIVRYPSPDWHVGQEWVYNSAYIDRQRVVFAHDLGTEQDRALLGYYPDRTAWLLTFDRVSGREHIEPYPPAPVSTAGGG
jgi:hypothetical protein